MSGRGVSDYNSSGVIRTHELCDVAQERRTLEDYYNRRAREYEEIYHRRDAIRQKELADIATAMKDVLVDRRVLEIACGTGFWTAVAAEVAEYVLAIDISEQMLSVAERKYLSSKKVKFSICNAYGLDSISDTFDAGLANFWLSHVPKLQLENFMHGFYKKLTSGAVVFMADNIYIPGIGGKLLRKSGCEDTFKLRELCDGSKYEVVKNYYDANQLREILKPFSSELQIKIGDCFWWVSYLVS